LVSYVADETLRGNLPFPRAKEEELLYVLRKTLELRLWPGSLYAALSDNPTQFCLEQPALGTNLSTPPTPKELISDSIKLSTIAHLFHFYPVLCEIASIPRKVPTRWVAHDSGNTSHSNKLAESISYSSELEKEKTGIPAVKELDARMLARECLREVGREMGVSL